MPRKVLSVGDRLQKNFKRVLQSKPANYTFPEKVIKAVYSDRSQMNAKEKTAQTRLMKQYSANKYAKLYAETKVEYGDVEYTVKEWKKIPKQQRKELESEFKKWTAQLQEERTYRPDLMIDDATGKLFDANTGEILEDNQSYGEIVYSNFVEEFLSRLQELTPLTTEYKGRSVKRNPLVIGKSERSKASLRSLVAQEVYKVGNEEVGRRIAENIEIVSRWIEVIIYESNGTAIDTAYVELAYVITNGNVSRQEIEDIGEQEEYNGVYN